MWELGWSIEEQGCPSAASITRASILLPTMINSKCDILSINSVDNILNQWLILGRDGT